MIINGGSSDQNSIQLLIRTSIKTWKEESLGSAKESGVANKEVRVANKEVQIDFIAKLNMHQSRYLALSEPLTVEIQRDNRCCERFPCLVTRRLDFRQLIAEMKWSLVQHGSGFQRTLWMITAFSCHPFFSGSGYLDVWIIVNHLQTCGSRGHMIFCSGKSLDTQP